GVLYGDLRVRYELGGDDEERCGAEITRDHQGVHEEPIHRPYPKYPPTCGKVLSLHSASGVADHPLRMIAGCAGLDDLRLTLGPQAGQKDAGLHLSRSDSEFVPHASQFATSDGDGRKRIVLPPRDQ